jgi:hypothetical protein
LTLAGGINLFGTTIGAILLGIAYLEWERYKTALSIRGY